MLQVRTWLFKAFGHFAVITCFRLCFILIGILTIVYAFQIRLSPSKICLIATIFVLGFLLTMWQKYFSEKTHVLTYGLLGYLAASDLMFHQQRMQFKNMALAAIFVSFISALDELFQGILPYRFAELKDFITNIISGSLGIAFRKILLYSALKDGYN